MSVPISRRRLLQLVALAPFLKLEWAAQPGAAAPPRRQGQTTPSNVLVVVFDTLSARHLSLYGYERATTPNLARFAERAHVYHRHYAAANFTSPGTSSLLTGAYSWSHRAFNMRGLVSDEYVGRSLFSAFDPQVYHRVAYTHSSLAMLLLNQFHGAINELKPVEDLYLLDDISADQLFPNDINSAVWSEQLILPKDGRLPTSLFMSIVDQLVMKARLQQIDATYSEAYPRGLPTTDQGGRFFVLDHAVDWLVSELRQAPTPFCIYHHLLPPHEPYRPRREFTQLFDDGWFVNPKPLHHFSDMLTQDSLNQRRLAYDQYIAYADAEFGRLYDALEQSGLLDTTLVVFTSDHGQLFERGIHGHITQTLYDPVIHVPLLIAQPGQRQRYDVRTPTSAVDVLPTLLHLTGQQPPSWSEGQVLPPFGGEPAAAGRSVFAVEAKGNFQRLQLERATVALIKDQHKLVHYFGYGGAYDNAYEFYDLEADPEELNDLAGSASPAMRAMQDELATKIAAVNQPFPRR